MKIKIIVSFLISIVLIFSKFCLISAAAGDPEAEILSNIDREKNITVIVKAINIKTLTGTIDFEDDILDYIGIEAKNNWQIDINSDTFEFSANSQSENNNEKVEILEIKFKVKENASILEAGVDLIELKAINDNGTVVDFGELNTTVTVNEDTNVVDDDESEEESSEEDGENNEYFEDEGDGEDYEEEFDDNEDEEDSEEDEEEEIFHDDEYGNDDEEDEEGSEEDGDYDGEFDNEVQKDESNSQSDEQDNLASGLLPQTGVASIVLGIILIIVAVTIATISLKKAKEKNK